MIHLKRNAAILMPLLAMMAAPLARADVRPNTLFSDNAVLQQGMAVPVWGTGFDGEVVTVSINGQKATTTTKGGKWMVRLKPMAAGGPHTLTIEGRNRIEIKNVLVGEVFLAGGQSNMDWPVAASLDPQGTAASSADSQLRLVTVPRISSVVPVESVKLNWMESGPSTVPNFSAVGYFFGAALRKARNVPIGIINSSYGGSTAEAWMHRSTLESTPEFKWALDEFKRRQDAYPQQQSAYLEALTKGQQAQRPINPLLQHNSHPVGLYNNMIVPIAPYGIKGAIWYQGESNAGRAYTYRTLMPALVKDWREDWGQGDFPFIQVQLAPFMAIEQEPKDSAWAELREAQYLAGKNGPNINSVVINDVGDEKDIHPKNKKPVGERLALMMRHMAFGENIVYSGPEYAGMKRSGNRIVIRFNHVGGGLVATGGGALTGFAICGADKRFVNANAEIKGNTVEVWNDGIAEPVAVRFGWANFPVVNLTNKEGLLAIPFRTDSFPGVTQGK
jgi:sialate O-acetylesterase